MRTYVEYLRKVAKLLKKDYDIKIDFKDRTFQNICRTGFELGSFPYYCADQFAEQTTEK